MQLEPAGGWGPGSKATEPGAEGVPGSPSALCTSGCLGSLFSGPRPSPPPRNHSPSPGFRAGTAQPGGCVELQPRLCCFTSYQPLPGFPWALILFALL